MLELFSLSEEQRIRLLVGSVTDFALYLIDANGRVASWNPGAERFKGYSADEIIGEPYARFFSAEDVAADVPGRALRVAAREGRYESEGWRVRKDGSRFWAHAVLDAVRDEDGTLIGFAKITRDITDKREREKALFVSEQQFRMLVQGVRDYAIFMLDRDGTITSWNSGAEAIKGYSADEAVGSHFSRFYTDADRKAGEPQQALETALRDGKYEREAQRVRKDGSLFWAHVIIDPIFDEGGRHVGFAKVTRDVSDRRRAQHELDNARESLAQAQKLQAIGELTGGIAHDFNNLMTVIAGASDFLLKHPDMPAEKQKRYLRAIADTTERATSLTSQLLAFGRRQALHPEVLDVNLRIDAFAEMVERLLGSRITLYIVLAADDALVEADPAQLDSALLNAIINARDAMPDGGTLTIATDNEPLDDGDAVAITVTDTGCGIPQDKLARVFEPFFTTKEVGKGTGLGLSQIHGFAAQAGGRAEIESAEGEGTVLRILLPKTAKLLTEGEVERLSVKLPRGLKVLLVEDNPQVRAFAAQLLEDLGCEMAAVADAAQALERLADNRFDLVFTDVVMPGMSGIALAEAIARDHPGTPVLLATGYSDELANKAMGAFTVLAKPYGAATLADAIAKATATGRETAEITI